MGRKKKIESHGGDVFTLRLDKVYPNTAAEKASAFGWVSWGQRNNWPNQILGLYSQSPTLSACVNFCVKALLGGGVDFGDMGLDGSQVVPNYRYGWDELIRRCSTDYFLLGGFALQVIKNNDGRTYSLYHQPMETVRCASRDDDGVVNDYYLCKDWTATAKYPPVRIPSLVTRPDGEWDLKRGEPYLFVPEFYSPIGDYYPTPCWTSAIKSVQSEVEMVTFDLRTASNIYCPAGAISLPPAESEEQKQAILNNIQSMFTGADNAQQLLVTFRNDSEDSPITFTPFTAASDNVDLFSTSNDRNVDRILSTFCIPSRSLIGLPLGNVGFSSESGILETAYNLYNTLAGNESRRAVIGVMNECFRANGIDVEIVLKTLSFGETADNGAADESQNISENNIEEQSYS